MRNCGCFAHDGFRLSPEGLAQRELELDGGVDVEHSLAHIDGRVSVSALVEVEDDFDYDENHMRLNQEGFIHHGS